MRLKKWLYTVEVMAGRPAEKEAPFFGKRLSAVRRSKGLTQQQLADKLGIKRSLIITTKRDPRTRPWISSNAPPPLSKCRSPNYWAASPMPHAQSPARSRSSKESSSRSSSSPATSRSSSSNSSTPFSKATSKRRESGSRQFYFKVFS